jgi:decaprenyl-phosphate phosphoribosyltransferase
MMRNYLRLMRIRHYIKNMLIFLPLIFSGNASDYHLLVKVIIGFISFSLAASMVYIINDIYDLEYDRNHETKKSRPLASGAVSTMQALMLAGGLAAVSVALIITVLNSPTTWFLLLSYVLINLAYSFGLKNISLVDITIIVAGFMLRVAFGGAIVSIGISSWMYLTVMAMSFYLAFGKRRNEMHKNGFSSRAVLKHYSVQFLDKMMYVSLGLTVMFYSMWCVTPNDFIKGDRLIWTVPLVLLICMKYSMDVEGDNNGDPAEVLLSDKVLILLVSLFAGQLMLLFYGARLLGILGI